MGGFVALRNLCLGESVVVYGLLKDVDVERCDSLALSEAEAGAGGCELVSRLWRRRRPSSDATAPAGGGGRVFAMSNSVKGECEVYVPSAAPPTVAPGPKGFSVDYIVAVRKPGASQPPLLINIKVDPSPALVTPLTEWIPSILKFRDAGAVTLQPPPIYPPVAPRPATLSYMALCWDLGACYATDTCVKLPVAATAGDSSFYAEVSRTEAGLAYLHWLSITSVDLASSVDSPQLAPHMTPTGVAGNVLDMYLEDSEAALAKLSLAIARRKASNKTPGRRLVDNLREGFDVPKLISSLYWLNDRPSTQLIELPSGRRLARPGADQGGEFVASFEAVSTRRSSRPYRVSVNNNYLCAFSVEHVRACVSPIPSLPMVKDFVSAGRPTRRLEADCDEWLIAGRGETINVRFDFQESTLAVLEVVIRLVRERKQFQPPLTPTESFAWVWKRNAVLASRSRSDTTGSAASWFDFAKLGGGAAATNSDNTLTLIESNTDVVAERYFAVSHAARANVPFRIPSDIEPSFRQEKMAVGYLLEIEFICIARHGVVLDLESRIDKATDYFPFVTISGPILSKNMSQVTWRNTLLVR